MTSSVDLIIDASQMLIDCETLCLTGIQFREKTLAQWEEDLKLPTLSDNMSYADIQKYNFAYVRLNEVIMSNYSYAKAMYNFSNLTYQAAIKSKTKLALDDIKKDSTKRAPGMDSLEKNISLQCIEEFTALKINEIFLDFWKIYYEKMQLLDSRLSNINYMYKGQI